VNCLTSRWLLRRHELGEIDGLDAFLRKRHVDIAMDLGVNFARHDGGTRLQCGEIDFEEPRAWPRSQKNKVTGNFRKLYGPTLQCRGINHKALLIPGCGDHV